VLELKPELRLALDRIEAPKLALVLEGIRGVLSGIWPGREGMPITNAVQVDRIGWGDYAASNLFLRGAALPAGRMQLEVTEAQLMGGRVRVPPFDWDTRLGQFEALFEFEEVSLASLAALLPRFAGSIEGALSGRVPVRFTAGEFHLGAGHLTLDRGRPARLQYPAAGLLTRGAKPGSDRYRQLALLEQALGDLSLTSLGLELFPSDQTQTPVRLYLEGTFASPDAVIPVRFHLNLNGDWESLVRLLGRGELEWNL
jgi:hypothetical protein